MNKVHVIEVTSSGNGQGNLVVNLRSYYHNTKVALSIKNVPGSGTPAIDTAREYLKGRGINITGVCIGKYGTHHIVTDTFKDLQ